MILRHVLWAVSLAIVCSGCSSGGQSPRTDVALFSLKNYPMVPDDPNSFHGYSILGQVNLNADRRDKVLAALRDGIANGKPEEMMLCFNPHHGIRVTEKGSTIDYVICFECNQYVKYTGEYPSDYEPFISNAEALFNEILKGPAASQPAAK